MSFLCIQCNCTYMRLEEKLFFSFVFFARAQKKSELFFGKTFFYASKSCFLWTNFFCACSLKINPVFLPVKPFFMWGIFMLSIYLLINCHIIYFLIILILVSCSFLKMHVEVVLECNKLFIRMWFMFFWKIVWNMQ